MLLKVQQEPLEKSLAANLQNILNKQLLLAATAESGEDGLAHDTGTQLDLLSISTSMQCMESLLENFPPGEGALKLQLPLGQCSNNGN